MNQSTSVDVAGLDIANPLFDAQHFSTVAGHPSQVFHVIGRRSGFNSTSVLQDVGEFLGTTIDTFPDLTGVENLELVSSSANDTAAGTGTRSVQIRYADTGNNIVVSAPITLNGVTPVAVPFKATFIYAMAAYTGGSSETSVGTILLRIAGGGATHEQITAGGNRSMSGRFLVPTGYHAHLAEWGVTAIGNATQDTRLRAMRNLDNTLATRYIFQDIDFVSSSTFIRNVLPWIEVPSLAKIKVSTISSVAQVGNRIDVTLSLILMKT